MEREPLSCTNTACHKGVPWPSSGWSMKQEPLFVVQGPCVVHGRAGKDIPCFNPLIVSVKNVLLFNDMQHVHGFLEKVLLRSQSH